MKQTFTNKSLSFPGVIRNYDAIPVYFSFKEQLITKIHEHVRPQLISKAINYIAYTNHYLLKQKINSPNRKALLFNVAMTLLGNVENQSHTTITLAYSIMELIDNAKQRQIEGSNSTISQGTRTTRKSSKGT